MAVVAYVFFLVLIESFLLIGFMLLASVFDKGISLPSVLIESVSTALFVIPYRFFYLNIPLVIFAIYIGNRFLDCKIMNWKFGIINAACFLLVFLFYAFFHSNSWRLLGVSEPYFRNIILFIALACLISPALLNFIKKC